MSFEFEMLPSKFTKIFHSHSYPVFVGVRNLKNKKYFVDGKSRPATVSAISSCVV